MYASNQSSSLSLQGSAFMDKLETKILFAIIMVCLCLLTTVGNIVVIWNFRKASLVGNLFIISLAFADLIVGCFVMPLASVYAITEVWILSKLFQLKFKMK
jgi:hypothetical protein